MVLFSWGGGVCIGTLIFLILSAPVAQLVEHWAVMREVMSSTPAGPSLGVLK